LTLACPSFNKEATGDKGRLVGKLGYGYLVEMFERTVTVEDLARLKARREEADRLYNEALTALDGAQLRLPDLPHPPPALDEHQITPLNQSWEILNGGGPPGAAAGGGGWRGRFAGYIWRVVFPFFERQQAFNARLVDHLNRNVKVERATREAIASTVAMLGDQLNALARFQSHLIVFLQQITPYVDTKDYEDAGLGKRVSEDAREVLDVIDHRTVGLGGAISGVSDELLKRWESMVAREQRYDSKVVALTAAHEELRSTIAILQQASLTLKREFERLRALPAIDASTPAGLAASATSTAASATSSSALTSPAERAAAPGVGNVPAAAPAALPASATSAAASALPSSGPTSPGAAGSHIASSIDSYKYVGFEDRYRGSQEDIRARLTAYLPFFEGASDVLDIGCGRGEFLDLLRERGISGRGLDVNHEMVEVCLARGLNVSEGDALSYLESQPDGSLGGLLAAQVVEHLEPGYLMQMLDVAYHKLRPGSRIILETINPACWFAFFSSYIRDITHVRPLHPDTLSYLLTASGFQRVTVRYEAPYPAHEKLQPIAGEGPTVEIFNANVEKLNGLMFTYLDYAAIGERR
jgi:SAM-dependent methyltransferase